MRSDRREFLESLLETASPSGFETAAQRRWLDRVEGVADEVYTDAYGNAVAAYNEGAAGPSVAFAGHADEIGYIVRSIDGDGFVHIGPIGGADRTVSKGQHVEIHAESGPVNGVIGQTAIHLRDAEADEVDDIEDQHVDIGVPDEAAARELVSVGDPVTVATAVRALAGTRLAARGMDNRVGIWAAAEGFREAVEAGVDTTVYAVSTVQEEVGLQGARMVGFDLAPDAAIALDVTHAVDAPGVPGDTKGEVELGAGPVIGRGSTNHPVLVEEFRAAAAAADVEVQLAAAGSRSGTDADAFYIQRGGIPALNLGLPNRYMHTPVEVIDTEDLTAAVRLLAGFADRVDDRDGFAVRV